MMTTADNEWTTLTNRCLCCDRTFRLSLHVVEEERLREPEWTDEQIADSIEFCHQCCDGEPLPGEYVGGT